MADLPQGMQLVQYGTNSWGVELVEEHPNRSDASASAHGFCGRYHGAGYIQALEEVLNDVPCEACGVVMEVCGRCRTIREMLEKRKGAAPLPYPDAADGRAHVAEMIGMGQPTPRPTTKAVVDHVLLLSGRAAKRAEAKMVRRVAELIGMEHSDATTAEDVCMFLSEEVQGRP